MPPSQADRTTTLFGKKHPMAELRRPPTGQYNCHGLTFATRRTSITDVQAVKTILEEDGYRRIRPTESCPGDIVLYYDQGEVSHTGVIARIVREADLVGGQAVWVISKWAYAGEYIHPAKQGPYSHHEMTFWTERPIL